MVAAFDEESEIEVVGHAGQNADIVVIDLVLDAVAGPFADLLFGIDQIGSLCSDLQVEAADQVDLRYDRHCDVVETAFRFNSVYFCVETLLGVEQLSLDGEPVQYGAFYKCTGNYSCAGPCIFNTIDRREGDTGFRAEAPRLCLSCASE